MAMDLQLEETSQQSIAQTTLAIPELAENVLNRLPDIRDLIHVRATSKALKTIVDGTPSIQRRLWQLPIPIPHDEDPHYPDLPQIMSTYPLKLSYQEVEWALEGIRRMEWDFYDAIEAGEDEVTAAAAREQQWERLWHPFEKFNYTFSLQTFFILTPQQHAFRCDSCRRLHPPYAASGLHSYTTTKSAVEAMVQNCSFDSLLGILEVQITGWGLHWTKSRVAWLAAIMCTF